VPRDEGRFVLRNAVIFGGFKIIKAFKTMDKVQNEESGKINVRLYKTTNSVVQSSPCNYYNCSAG
jgi:hypothetical protein